MRVAVPVTELLLFAIVKYCVGVGDSVLDKPHIDIHMRYAYMGKGCVVVVHT